MQPETVLQFWFVEQGPAQWFAQDAALDATIAIRFEPAMQAALRGELADWRETPAGRLAELLLLDQFFRNVYRDSARQFAADPLALGLAQEAVRQRADQALPVMQRKFVYMPYMHSESLPVQTAGMPLFERLGDADTLDYARRHREIIERFGRFPHRNAVLRRSSTPAEQAFLQQPDSHF